MKLRNTYLLIACVFVMALLCVLSIESPMRFDRERIVREKAVKGRLVKIRAAEEKYLMKTGGYTGSFDVLVRAGLLADSLRYVPYTDRKPFTLQVTTVTGKRGNQIPLMECGTHYEDYLHDLDAKAVTSLTEEAYASGRFPGLKVGDLETPNNNAGNWE